MYLNFNVIIALHAGTPLVVSQASLTLMFVVLGVLGVGVGFGLLTKNRDNLLLHRWSMSIAVFLASLAIFLVMLPSAFRYYIDPDVNFLSSLSVLTIFHGIIGVPAILLGVMYALGDLPKRLRYWMRWAAVFWVASLVFGVILYFDMLGLLSVPSM